MHDDEAVEVTEAEAQAEDDAVSAEEVDSSYEDEGEAGGSSSESEPHDAEDADYDPRDDAAPTMEDEGYYDYIDLMETESDEE